MVDQTVDKFPTKPPSVQLVSAGNGARDSGREITGADERIDGER